MKAVLADQREQLLASASVHVLGKLYPGVVIRLGVHSLSIDEPDTHVHFSWDAQRRSIRRESINK
jgi:hypothetical protein